MCTTYLLGYSESGCLVSPVRSRSDVSADDNNGDDGFGESEDWADPGYSHEASMAEAGDLLEAPRKVEKISVTYSKASKQVLLASYADSSSAAKCMPVACCTNMSHLLCYGFACLASLHMVYALNFMLYNFLGSCSMSTLRVELHAQTVVHAF